MSNPSGRKGAGFERDLVGVAHEAGFEHAERAPKKGAKDEGDLFGIPELTVEAKNEKTMDLASAVDESIEERANRGTPWTVAAVKRRGKNARHAYAVEEWAQHLEKHQALLDAQAAARAAGELASAVDDVLQGGDISSPVRRHLRRALVLFEECR